MEKSLRIGLVGDRVFGKKLMEGVRDSMAEELKTLKDIEYDEDSSKIDLDDFWVNSSVLRKEAIKWVKKWKKLDDIPYAGDYVQAIFAFEHFFNITEGDLK